MHVMTRQGKALRKVEELANLLQRNRGTSATRWVWCRGEYSLSLYPRVPVTDESTDMAACGEVLHLVRSVLVDDGWEVQTIRYPGGAAVLALEILGERLRGHYDELLTAILADPRERGSQATVPADPYTASVLLHDAAVEHGAELTMLSAGEAADAGVRISHPQSWAVVDVGWRGDDGEASVAVLGIREDTPQARLRAGEAAADMQLTATASGLDIQPLDEADLLALKDYALTGDMIPVQAFKVVSKRAQAPSIPRPRTAQLEPAIPLQRVAV